MLCRSSFYRMLPMIAVLACALYQVRANAEAGPITFYKDVAPIFQENCQTCHRPGGADIMGMVAPMSLVTYAEVRPWAKAIARQVKARTMPPWHASAEFEGVFSNERTLTVAEIETILRWEESGARRGAPGDAPPRPNFLDTEGWTIGKPDLVVSFEEPYFVPDRAEDLYQNIVVQLSAEDMPEDKWIKAMQFKPGSEVVHHIVLFTDGYRESLGFGSMGMLGGMGPGTDASVFPDDYGRRLNKGSRLVFNMHYHKESGPGTGVWDSSSIGFIFQDKPVHHAVNWGSVGTMSLAIPPYAENYEVTAQETFSKDTTILSFFPHTHLRGKASKYVAYYPDGREEVLLDVPKYDFNWQTNYILKEPKKIPAGTRVEVTMTYDNTEERAKFTGIDPSRTVYWGEATTAEMMFGWIDYCDTEPRDVQTD